MINDVDVWRRVRTRRADGVTEARSNCRTWSGMRCSCAAQSTGDGALRPRRLRGRRRVAGRRNGELWDAVVMSCHWTPQPDRCRPRATTSASRAAAAVWPRHRQRWTAAHHCGRSSWQSEVVGIGIGIGACVEEGLAFYFTQHRIIRYSKILWRISS